MSELVKKSVEDWLREVDYSDDPDYVPSEFALEFINFIKMVNGEQGEENASPVVHFNWLDNLCNRKQDSVALCARGFAKSSVFAEYLFLYLAVFGSIPGFGEVDYVLYVSDSIDNGVKKMRNRIERRFKNSEFLQEYLPESKITDTRWYFKNKFGKEFVVTGHGVSTGVRGTVELNTRPQLAVLDDLVSDEDARSQTIIEKIEDVVYSAIDNALHPSRRKIIWCGTPFNAKDPLYKAVESGAWYVSVFPVCEKFPCSKEEFRGGWEDRFPYEFVKSRYDKAVKTGKVSSFNQELMLRIMSEEERLIEDGDLRWYKRRSVLDGRGAYNIYFTTDFATSDKQHADYSVINCWALNSLGDWYWVDGVCKQMLMDQTMRELFRLAQKWSPQAVGIEVSGQQGGFLRWIAQLMQDRNIFFNLACPIGSNKPGLRPTKDKMSRFQTNAVPLFKSGKIYFPEELRESEELREILDELKLATIKGFKSKHDDCHPFQTLVDTPLGQMPIGLLRDGDRVFTYRNDHRLTGVVSSFRMTGIKEILRIRLHSSSVIECSPYHPILTDKGYVVAKDLTVNSMIVRSKICKSCTTLSSGQRNLQDTTSQQSGALTGAERTGCTSTSMRKKLASFLMGMKYTISMRIRIITNRTILHYLRLLNTEQDIRTETLSHHSTQGTERCNCSPRLLGQVCTKGVELSANEQEKYQGPVPIVSQCSRFTIKLTTTLASVLRSVVTSGIELTMWVLSNAGSVGSPFYKKHLVSACVAQYASPTLRENRKQSLKPNSASSVDKHSLMVGELLRAEKNATEYERIVKTENTELVQVKSVEGIGLMPTFNFEVNGTHNYSVENGHIVHNCIDTISMLGEMEVWRPSETAPEEDAEEQFVHDKYFGSESSGGGDSGGGGSSYFV